MRSRHLESVGTDRLGATVHSSPSVISSSDEASEWTMLTLRKRAFSHTEEAKQRYGEQAQNGTSSLVEKYSAITSSVTSGLLI